jgi:serine/threonine protein kinase
MHYLIIINDILINNIPEDRDDIVSVHYTDDKLTDFEIEGEIEGKLKKPNAKKYCDVELSLNPINLIMEHGGYSLSSVMKVSPKSKGTRAIMHQMFIDNLRPYFKHLILGVVKMHNNRIVNRDIKQKNIMMNLNKKTKTFLHKFKINSSNKSK